MSARLLIAAFLLALAAPWFDLCVRPAELRDPSGYENRSIAAFPQLAWNAALLNQFPPRFERYFADRLGTRDLLLRTHSIQSLEWLGVHPANNMYLGKEDWWFYSGDQALELLRTGSRLDPQELETWAASLARIARWCEAQGIPFAVAFGPNKETIYPDYLPAHLSDCRSARLDQLMPELKARGVRCIDLRPALRAAREGDTPGDWLYHRLGTHWTDRGGLIAAQAVLAALSADMPGCGMLNAADYERVPAAGEEDSLAARSYLGGRHLQHPWSRVPRGGFRAQAESLETLPYPITERRDPARTDRPRLLMIHDSFGAPIDKYLAEVLGSLVQTHRYALDRDLVARFKPDVVLAVYVERHLGGAPFTLVGGYSPEERAALFERSPTMLHSWTGGSGDFVGRRGSQLEFRDGVLAVRTNSSADTLLLPVMPYPAEGGALLRLEIESGQAQVFDLFYLRPGYEDYDRSANIELPLEPGMNQVTVVLDQPGLHGRLCLRARVPGRWRLRSLELRAPPP